MASPRDYGDHRVKVTGFVYELNSHDAICQGHRETSEKPTQAADFSLLHSRVVTQLSFRGFEKKSVVCM